MEMETHAYQGIPGLPPPSSKDHTPYIDRITGASNSLYKSNRTRLPIPNPMTDFIIYISFLISDPEWWAAAFTKGQRSAARFPTDLNTHWETIRIALYTPELEKVIMLCLPLLDREKYFPQTHLTPDSQKITPRPAPAPKKKQLHKRGELWKLDGSWDNLWKSSQNVFTELLRRTQYPKNSENFPWCQAGIKSLHKFTGVSPRQIERALSQLERFKLIKRIVKGNEFQGCSKYLVFIVPKMSGAFSRKSLHTKKDPTSKKRIIRMR